MPLIYVRQKKTRVSRNGEQYLIKTMYKHSENLGSIRENIWFHKNDNFDHVGM